MDWLSDIRVEMHGIDEIDFWIFGGQLFDGCADLEEACPKILASMACYEDEPAFLDGSG